jgi:hypothetical protein
MWPVSRRLNKTGNGDDDPTLIDEVAASCRRAAEHLVFSMRACSAGIDWWASSEGRARRPLASHASNSKFADSPRARHRINSTSQRARPTPGTGRGVDGSIVMRQCVVADRNRQVRLGGASAAARGRSRRSFPRRVAVSAKVSWGGGQLPRRPRRARGSVTFFEAGEDRFLVSRFDIDHPIWREPGRSECRREQILAGDAPSHLLGKLQGHE